MNYSDRLALDARTPSLQQLPACAHQMGRLYDGSVQAFEVYYWRFGSWCVRGVVVGGVDVTLHCTWLCHNHRRAVAQPCVNGDWLSKGRMAKFDPAQIRNPWTDRHKIWNGWLRRRDDPPCKISCKSIHWGLLGKWVKYNENFSPIYIPFFCWPTYRSDRQADFHARWLEQRGLMQGSNLFGNRNSKLISNPWKFPPKSKLGKKPDWNFRPKTLLYKNFTYKRPLIVIVGP